MHIPLTLAPLRPLPLYPQGLGCRACSLSHLIGLLTQGSAAHSLAATQWWCVVATFSDPASPSQHHYNESSRPLSSRGWISIRAVFATVALCKNIIRVLHILKTANKRWCGSLIHTANETNTHTQIHSVIEWPGIHLAYTRGWTGPNARGLSVWQRCGYITLWQNAGITNPVCECVSVCVVLACHSVNT